MEANWRPVQGSNRPAGVDPNASAAAGGDWRHPESRSRIANKIMETLKKHRQVSEPEGLNELQRVVVLFEETIYSVAIDQNDYLRKLSLEMLSLEANTQQAPGNAQVIPNQNNPGEASGDNTAQTGHTGVGDWQEETYQMIKSLKGKYFAELNDLFSKISVKLHHVDSTIPPRRPSEHHERMKSFKMALDRILQLLQVSKSAIQPALRDKVPKYEKQIISMLNSQRRKPVQVQPQAQQQFLNNTHQNGAKRQRIQAGSGFKAARRRGFDSVRYSSIFDEWRSITGGEHWADAGYSTADFWYSGLSKSRMQTNVDPMQANARDWIGQTPNSNISQQRQPSQSSRQRQAGSGFKAARRRGFDSVRYGSIFDEWRSITGGEHWADEGYSTADLW